MKLTKLATIVSAVFLLTTTPSLAHDAKGHNGGRIADAGNYHVELVAKGEQVEVYLIDHNNKQMTLSGYKGVAILGAGGKSQRIVLESADGARLAGKAEAALPAQPKGVVQITPPNGKTVQAKFN